MRSTEAIPSDEGRPSLSMWIGAARPATLPAAVVPVVVGLALAGRAGKFDLIVAAATMGAAILIQVGTNLANDYYDFVAGADTADRLGPQRLSQGGIVAISQVRNAAFVVLGLAALIGLYLVYVGGWPILIVGMLSIVCAVGYSAGPWPIAYHGLAEVFVFVFFGVVAVNGTFFLQTETVSILSLLASVPVGCLVTAILVVNNLRDIPTDDRAGKRTLAVRIGPGRTRTEIVVLVAAAFIVLPLIAWIGGLPVLLAVGALPMAILALRRLRRRTGAALNQSLVEAARVHLAYGLLLSIGLLL